MQESYFKVNTEFINQLCSGTVAFTAIFFSEAFLLRNFVIKGVVKEVLSGQN